MKSLREHLNESIFNYEDSWDEIINKIISDGISKGGSLKKVSKNPVFQPKTRTELEGLVKRLIKERGNNANLNDIDTSLIIDMAYLFAGNKYPKFNGDISKWDVSNVENMENMFWHSNFNSDISNWDVSKVKNMTGMFYYSRFNGDISKWDVRNVEHMENMFWHSNFNSDISNWDVSNVKYMTGMFERSKFNGDLSKWNVRNVEYMYKMFERSPLEGNEPEWYKER